MTTGLTTALTTTPAAPLAEAIRARMQALLAPGTRKILGLVGPPGAGKSTLAQQLVQAFAPQVCNVPMDGFHLAQRELERLGRASRKGAPDTFDVTGYAHLLHRLRLQEPHETVYAPDFERRIEEPIAGAIAIAWDTPLVVTEGNYLLLDAQGWAQVRKEIDVVWYLDLKPQLRQQRLLARHMHFGRSQAQALAWAAATDEPNARLVEETRARADWIVPLP